MSPEMDTSPHARCKLGSKADALEAVISPVLKKPKKQTAAAAQSKRSS